MKIAYYCQHVLGIGHFHRSLAICQELAATHQVTLILGGPDVAFARNGIATFQLPGLQMDENFKNLHPCNPGLSLEQTREQRQAMLYSWFEQNRPDAFMVELYPFGRKAFRFELDPVLKGIATRDLAPCRCFVSLRDILVERPDDKEKFERRVVDTLNNYFSGVLVHADERLITLDKTFARIHDITIPISYTGFITRSHNTGDRERVRRHLALSEEQKLITVSIGGGNVGKGLLAGAIGAFAALNHDTYRMQLFCGPYFPENDFRQFQDSLPEGAVMERFTDEFPAWLAASDLSISMAGYNTSMNILTAGVPALVYPFSQNREQRCRTDILSKYADIITLTADDLEPRQLAGHIARQSRKPRYRTTINMDGAARTVQLLENLMGSPLP